MIITACSGDLLYQRQKKGLYYCNTWPIVPITPHNYP